MNNRECNQPVIAEAPLAAWYSGSGEETFPALLPFAWDERMCAEVGRTGRPALHLWRHPRAFVIGLRDRRLPHAEEALAWLRAEGYDAIVRNSGGAAVPLNSGVVNLSLVLPNPERKIDLCSDFKRMVELIRRSLTHWTADVKNGEIGGSYCPGEFDLSIEGRKFCGIAQRRQMNGFVIQAFVNVDGSGVERARLVKQFYERASGNADPASYPDVRQDRMASLYELLSGGITADQFVASVLDVVREDGGVATELHPDELLTEEMVTTIEKLRQRYDR